MIDLFDIVEIIDGYREGEMGKVISKSDNGITTVCEVQFDDYEVHAYNIDDLEYVEEQEMLKV